MMMMMPETIINPRTGLKRRDRRHDVDLESEETFLASMLLPENGKNATCIMKVFAWHYSMEYLFLGATRLSSMRTIQHLCLNDMDAVYIGENSETCYYTVLVLFPAISHQEMKRIIKLPPTKTTSTIYSHQ
jgi:hypothetical protein